MINVVIADDHPVMLQGVGDIFRSTVDICVIGAYSDGAQALKAIREFNPAVAVLDVSMPEMTGLEVLSVVNKEQLASRILLLAAAASSRDIITAMAEGAFGFLLKESSPDEILRCVRDIAAGCKCLPFESLEQSRQNERQDESDRVPIEKLLTPREWKVMALAAQGLSNKQIARHLNLTEGTAKIHLHHIFQKVGVKNRTALANMNFRHSILKPTRKPSA